MINMRALSGRVAVVAMLVASSLFAASRGRAVRPVPEGFYSGSVIDASTSRPVIEAEVTTGTRTVKTDARGAFSILIPAGRSVSLTIRRTGYDDLPLAVSIPAIIESGGIIISPSPPPTVQPPAAPVSLHPRSPVVVKLTNGQTVTLDAETVKFSYVLPFQSPATSENASFCKPDGSAFTPDRSEFSRVTGPAVSLTSSECCKLGPALAVNVEMKSGEKTQVFFTDSCFGYDVNFSGRERESAQYVYLKFTEIAQIDFP